MKNFVSLLSAVLLATSTLAAHASPLNVFGSGVTVLLDGSVVDTANVNLVPNGFSILDHGSLFTALYTTTPTVGLIPGTGLLNITDACVSAGVSLGGAGTGSPCQALAFSFTDANFGAVQIGAATAVGLQETLTASGNTAGLTVAQSASIGLGTAAFTFIDPVSAPPSTSPVPEPGTLSLVATGLIGAAGAIRRKLMS